MTLPSDHLGEDWSAKTQELDRVLGPLGYELSEESVFVLFAGPPSDPKVPLIGRPVIGPLRGLDSPLKLIDWKSGVVQRYELKSETWTDLWSESQELWNKLPQNKLKTQSGFAFRISRALTPILRLRIEVLFWE